MCRFKPDTNVPICWETILKNIFKILSSSYKKCFGRMVWGAGSGLANANGMKSARPPWHKNVGSMILTQANTAKSQKKQTMEKMITLLTFLLLSIMVRILTWNVRGAMSSTLCLNSLLDNTHCDIAVISEHKLKKKSTTAKCT